MCRPMKVSVGVKGSGDTDDRPRVKIDNAEHFPAAVAGPLAATTGALALPRILATRLWLRYALSIFAQK